MGIIAGIFLTWAIVGFLTGVVAAYGTMRDAYDEQGELTLGLAVSAILYFPLTGIIVGPIILFELARITTIHSAFWNKPLLTKKK